MARRCSTPIHKCTLLKSKPPLRIDNYRLDSQPDRLDPDLVHKVDIDRIPQVDKLYHRRPSSKTTSRCLRIVLIVHLEHKSESMKFAFN